MLAREVSGVVRTASLAALQRRSLARCLLPGVFLVVLLAYAMKHCSVYTLYEQNTEVTLPEGCRVACNTSFGTILGSHNGLPAMSNCNSTICTASNWHVAEHQPATLYGDSAGDKIFGMKWQCVEYARRYWMLRGTPLPARFDSVAGAADIWALTEAHLLNGRPPAPGTDARPRVGDLLIYPQRPEDFPHGHVAVIVEVTAENVLVAEQNWDNAVWPAPHHNYSRAIPLSCTAAPSVCTITEADDVAVQGWVRYVV
uniref:D-alanyl-glycyl endopeptidase-like protein n=1 Tax=Trypanosoma vivax (strain Y486) TaxID=1055687 RepID=G0TRU4_TRYVY|nr:D-alanyl-glycyl endopeptidase-like protein [Trypanosoma vivax Y486]